MGGGGGICELGVKYLCGGGECVRGEYIFVAVSLLQFLSSMVIFTVLVSGPPCLSFPAVDGADSSQAE